jgi:UDP:flavonoid glycosyltransferase YjiC (YdhE family)
MFYLVESPFFNVHLYPEALDYDVQFPGKWLKLRSAIYDPPRPIEIPDKLRNLPGKLIYINLGCNQIIYSFVLNKLLTILPQLNHRFIISMDISENQIAPNMYVNNEIDSAAVMQVADLVIHHGGTKILTDQFHFGVPGIVICLCGDQIDNGNHCVLFNTISRR